MLYPNFSQQSERQNKNKHPQTVDRRNILDRIRLSQTQLLIFRPKHNAVR